MPSGESALQRAQYYGHSELVSFLLTAHPLQDFATAVTLGDSALVDKQLKDHPELVNELSGDGFMPLCLAAGFGRNEIARLLLAAGADPNMRSTALGGVAPLDSAVFGNSEAAVELLLESGANPNLPQAGGFRPLHGACQNGNLAIVKLLLKFGADPQVPTDEGKRPEDFAKEDTIQVIRAFLSSQG
jgi:ankyrin repeat protein